MRAWVIRAGRSGEREDWALANGVAGGGFREIGDLTPYATKDHLAEAVGEAYPGKSKAFVSNFTGQLWSLRKRIEVGDLVVMPMKTTGMLAIGTITGDYEYRNDPELNARHVRTVQWVRSDVPRSAVGQDLLFTLNGAATVFGCERNSALARLIALRDSGKDPGFSTIGTQPASLGEVEPGSFDLEQSARDAISSAVITRFAGHGLARVTAEILQAQGFTCTVSPPGPDGGVDVFAGRGPLGLDSPRIVVQVKSDAAPVGAPVVQQLQGALATHHADQGLLVAWGGVSKPARQALAGQHFRVRVWDAQALVSALCDSYNQLSDELRAELPLKQVWTLVQEEETTE
ncbi:MAG: restriction endonuclease [Burkholderiales bacterium]|jgi:restriction system protein